ncbi:DNA topoisomerase 2 [Medicago truncatula]|nr:DNA topoisomerase 2 [Medicago truncatula]
MALIQVKEVSSAAASSQQTRYITYSTTVTFKPDLTKFQMTCLEEDVVALMKKRVLDMAGCLGDTVTVELIGEVIPFKSFKGYADFLLNCAQESKPFPLPRTHVKLSDSLEICLSLSDGKFQQVSFVNSIATIKGGTHVDYITKQITTYIKKEVLKKKEHVNVNFDTVKNHLWVFVNARIDNPAFHSQTKEMLTTKPARLGLKFFPGSMLNDVQKSEIAKTLLPRIQIYLKQTHVDAKLAGGPERGKCTLILTLGESAFAMAGVTLVDPDLYGVFPLSSKLLNVRDSRKLLKKKEIQILMTILGLVRNKKYSDAESLRYGRLMIMAYQDEDGAQLKGLLINFIYSFWPSLLKVSKFMSVFTFPIMKASDLKKGKELSFDSMQQYEDWIKELGNTANDWDINYCKGFSAAREVREYFQDLGERRAYFVWDDDDEQDGTSTSIELAFSKKAEEWMAWVCNSQMMQPGTCNYESKSIKYRDFVNKELLFFSMKNLQGSIPSMVDGLTLGQRKTLFTSFKMNLTKPTEVFRLTAYVNQHSDCHGDGDEQSIASTIIGMAQDFVGSNNINLLVPYGQFGTRDLGGKDHASFRKLCTNLNCVTRLLFPVDDDKLLEYLNENGNSIEPNWYIPIIPLVLVNGCHATGTCFSSDIPKYHPCEIIENVRRFLNKEEMVPMKPWYRGFRGTIKKSAKGYTINGLVERINEQTVRIEELPIRMWTEDYKKFLEKKNCSGAH